MSTIRCDECGIGHCQPFRTTYLLNIGRHMLVIPDSLAYRCDICDNRFFDEDFLDGVHLLLAQATADSKKRSRRSQLAPPEPVPPLSLRRSH